ncbi:MAG: nitroreductase family protein [Salinivirgaceae bacterium]|nr:nitroreductase family protein [Salinivirgaceae bacterium]
MLKIKLLLTATVAALLVGCCNNEKSSSNAVSFDDVIASRRSVRSYDSTKTISEAQVRELLTSAQQAPSWANQQPTKYYVAQSAAMIDSVKNYIGGNRRNVEGAPILIVSTFERGKSGFFNGNPANDLGDLWGAYDNGLANCYLILKARAMGFDTLIMGMRDSDALRRLFNIPENEAITAVISLGYRSGEPRVPQHKNLDDIVKFF